MPRAFLAGYTPAVNAEARSSWHHYLPDLCQGRLEHLQFCIALSDLSLNIPPNPEKPPNKRLAIRLCRQKRFPKQPHLAKDPTGNPILQSRIEPPPVKSRRGQRHVSTGEVLPAKRGVDDLRLSRQGAAPPPPPAPRKRVRSGWAAHEGRGTEK